MKKEVLSTTIKNCIGMALTVIFSLAAHYVVCIILNAIIPRLIPTNRTAQQFWVIGIGTIAISCAGFAMLKVAWKNSTLGAVRSCVFTGMGAVCESFIVICALALLVEGVQYAAWVEQFETITAESGADVRFWLTGVLFANGLAGNLLAAFLTS